jgi:hypothetical protein
MSYFTLQQWGVFCCMMLIEHPRCLFPPVYKATCVFAGIQ